MNGNHGRIENRQGIPVHMRYTIPVQEQAQGIGIASETLGSRRKWRDMVGGGEENDRAVMIIFAGPMP